VNNVIQGAVLETPDGVEALECAGLAEAVIFSDLPKELNPKPILSMNVEAETASESEVTLSYLTQGIEWEADYRLDMGSGQSGEGPLSGWLTVTNNTAKTFKDVPTAIIAGKLNRDYQTRSNYVPQKRYSPHCWPKGSTKTGVPTGLILYSHEGRRLVKTPARSVERAAYAPVAEYTMGGFAEDEIIVTAQKRQATLEDFADYKLYRVPDPVTVAAMQTKQISFLDVPNAEYERVYKTALDWWDIDVEEDREPYNSEKYIEIDNSREGNLAKPLPKGNMWVMTERENGKTAYLGVTDVKDMAVDLPVELRMEESPYVQALPTLKLGEHEGQNGVLVGVDVFNPMPEDIIFEFTLNATNIGVNDIQGSSHSSKMDEARPVYKFPVPSETRTPFYLFFEYLSSQYFSYDDVTYVGDEPGNTDVVYSTPGLFLKNGGGRVEWLEDLVDQIDDREGELKMTATLIEIEEFEDTNTKYEYRARETFKFSNYSDRDQIVTFDFDDWDVDLEKSSMEPDDASLPAWKFEVKKGKSVTLDVTFLSRS